MIVRRPGEDEREVLDEGVIDTVLPGVSDGNYVDAPIVPGLRVPRAAPGQAHPARLRRRCGQALELGTTTWVHRSKRRRGAAPAGS